MKAIERLINSIRISLILILLHCSSCVIAQKAKLNVESSPSDAKVYLNEQFYGNTPITLDLNCGEYHLVVRNDIDDTFCNFAERTINLSSCNSKFVSLELQRIKYSEISNPVTENDILNSLVNELSFYIDKTGTDIVNCCTLFGGPQPKIEYDMRDAIVDEVMNSITIPMTVSWVGTMSGGTYYVRGKLKVYLKHRTKSWVTLERSMGISCSDDCIN